MAQTCVDIMHGRPVHHQVVELANPMLWPSIVHRALHQRPRMVACYRTVIKSVTESCVQTLICSSMSRHGGYAHVCMQVHALNCEGLCDICIFWQHAVHVWYKRPCSTTMAHPTGHWRAVVSSCTGCTRVQVLYMCVVWYLSHAHGAIINTTHASNSALLSCAVHGE